MDFSGTFTVDEMYDKMHAPMKVFKNKKAQLECKPCINKNILKLIKEKKQTYKKYTKDRDLFWYNRYKNLRKLVKAMIDKSEKSYLRSFFQENAKKRLKNPGAK